MVNWIMRLFQGKRKEEVDAQHKLCNILAFAHDLVQKSEVAERQVIFSLIRMITNQVTIDNTMSLISEKRYRPPAFFYFIHYNNPNYDRNQFFASLINSKLIYTGKPFEIDVSLANDPVIVIPHNKDKLLSKMSKIATVEKPWVEDTKNHCAHFCLPMYVTVIQNGYHSTCTGIIKSEGNLHISKESSHTICDFGNLYPIVKFDGANYVFTETGEIIGSANSFEFGCLYEIGRIIRQYNIPYSKALDL